MEIAAVGRGNVGGGLAKRWRRAGHEVTEVGRAAEYEPVSAGDLENARLLEDSVSLLMAVSSAGSGPVFYRVGPPDAL
jgi:predicted dinucleotide-binding enzyme